MGKRRVTTPKCPPIYDTKEKPTLNPSLITEQALN